MQIQFHIFGYVWAGASAATCPSILGGISYKARVEPGPGHSQNTINGHYYTLCIRHASSV